MFQRAMLLFPFLAGGLVATAADAPVIPQETEFTVKLLAPLSTQTNKKGDKITAQVVSPAEFKDDMVEGEVKESKSGGKMTGKSVLNFTFHKLHHKGKEIPVQAQVKGFVNSKGQKNVDEEGRVIEKKSNIGKAAAATGAGAIIGAIAGGGRGAAIGAGIGAAAAIALIQVSATGANVTFAPGSEVVLSVKELRR